MSLLSTILRAGYSGLWAATQPFLSRHKRLQHGFAQRMVPPGWPGCASQQGTRHPAHLPALWVQAASGGECTLVPPLVQAVRQALAPATPCPLTGEQVPNGRVHGGLVADGQATDHNTPVPLPVLATTCTRQGMDILEKNTPGLSTAGSFVANYFPLDSPALMAKAFAQSGAGCAVLLETELWPGFMHEATRAGVPYAIVNARMTEKSFGMYQKFRSFFTAHPPAFVAATTQESADRFSSLFAAPASLMPNIKFDLAQNSLGAFASSASGGGKPAPQAHAGRAVFGIPAETPLALLASVRQEEEALILPGLAAFLQARITPTSPAASGDTCLVVAPRHLERVPAWMAACKEQGIPFALRSQGTEALAARPRVIVWDVFGELATVYAMADAVFVGGSLAPLGGQNFLEALAAGLCPVIGPSWSNFTWVGDGLFSQGLVTSVPDAKAMWVALRQSLEQRAGSLASHTPDAVSGRRAEQVRQTQERFTRWLAPLCGGSKQAGTLVAEKLVRRDRK